MGLEKRIHQAAEVFEDEGLEEEEEEDEDEDDDDDDEEEDEYAEDSMVLTPKNNPPPASAPPLNFLSKPTVFDEDDDEDDEEEEEEEEEDDPHSPSSSSNLLHTPPPSSTPSVAVAGNPVLPLASCGPDLKRQEEPSSSSLLITPHPTEKKHASLDDSRRLFQRLWTDEDEMELLQGFLEYTAHRTTTSHHDTAAFYDQIRTKLQLHFNKNQLVEKLRRLKKKYRNVTARISSGKDFAFKTPHEHATFELSRKIWCNTHPSVSAIVAADNNTLDEDDTHAPPPLPPPIHNNNNNNNSSSGACQIADGNMAEGKGVRSRKRPRPPPEKHSLLNHLHSNNVHMGPSFANIVEDTVRSCLSPMFKELLQTTINGGCSIGGCSNNEVSLFGGAGIGVVAKQTGDERWKKQQILELEVYSKRLELVQEHIQITLQQLRSGGT